MKKLLKKYIGEESQEEQAIVKAPGHSNELPLRVTTSQISLTTDEGLCPMDLHKCSCCLDA